MHIRYDEHLSAYKNLKPGETFIYDNELHMVIDNTDPGADDVTYASVNLETGKITYALANGSMVKKADCEVLVKAVGLV